MIEVTQDFLHKLAQAAQAGLGLDIDIHSAEGIVKLQELAFQLLQNPEDERSIAVLGRLDKLLEDPTPAAELSPGFNPKIDVDFHLAERDNYFRPGKSFPDDTSSNLTP